VATGGQQVGEGLRNVGANRRHFRLQQSLQLCPPVERRQSPGYDFPLIGLSQIDDGLAFYRRISQGLDKVLGGWVVLEVGMGQADAVALLLQQAFVKTRQAEVSRHSDLGGHTRCVAFKLQS